MNRIIRILLIVTCGVTYGSSTVVAKKRLPRFEDYPVHEHFTGKTAHLKLSSHESRMFRGQLEQAAKQKPNFAGHCIVAEWGCGSGCASVGIVDAVTGETFVTHQEQCHCDPVDGLAKRALVRNESLIYHLDSRLIIFTCAADDHSNSVTLFYEYQNNRLKLIRSVPVHCAPF